MATLKELNQYLLAEFPQDNGKRFQYHENGATLPPDWILQTPNIWGMDKQNIPLEKPAPAGVEIDPDFGLPICKGTSVAGSLCVCKELKATVTKPGMLPKKLCMGHSTQFVDEFYNLITSAEREVMISTLGEISLDFLIGPDGHFLAALRNAITYLGHTKKKITIYLLVGIPKPGNGKIDASIILNDLIRDLRNIPDAQVTVTVLVSGSIQSWNHAKMLIVDGNKTITGGHNLYHSYLGQYPVFDLSMKLKGNVSIGAQHFFVQLWETSLSFWAKGESTYQPKMQKRGMGLTLLNNVINPSEQSISSNPNTLTNVTGYPAMAIGRIKGPWDTEPSDKALLYLFANAQHSIKISQQSIRSLKIWPDKMLTAIASFILNKRKKVSILLSSSYAKDWYNSETHFSEVHSKFFDCIKGLPNAPKENEIKLLVQQCLQVEHIAFSADYEWEKGRGIGNHAKLVIIDDELFYIGSHNIYPTFATSLQEFGFIIQSKEATKQLLDQYWNKLWKYSQSSVDLRLSKAEYSVNEVVDVWVKVGGEIKDDSIRFIDESGREEWWTWTDNIREGYVTKAKYKVPDKFLQSGQNIRVEYITNGNGVRLVRQTANFRIKATALSIRTDKNAYKAGEHVWVNIPQLTHQPKNDAITFHLANGQEVGYLWTDGVSNGYLKNTWVIPNDLAGQTLTAYYRYDGGAGGKKTILSQTSFAVAKVANTITIKAEKNAYKPGEHVWINVAASGHQPNNDAVTFHSQSGKEEGYIWTDKMTNGYIKTTWQIPAHLSGQTITIYYRYDAGIGGKRQIMAQTTLKVEAVTTGVELRTGKVDYMQNEIIDVWVKVNGTIKDDTIRFIDESGREEWWTWTNNIREGRIVHAQYQVSEKYMPMGQLFRIEYIFDGHNTRQVRQKAYCRIKPMLVILKTDKPTYQVGESVWVHVMVYHTIPKNDAITFHRPDGKEDSYLWTDAITNGYLKTAWKAPNHLRGQTVTICYRYDGGLGGKKIIIAQTTFKIV